MKLKLALCGEFGALTAYSNSKEGNLLSYNNLNGFNDLMAVMDMLDGINSYYSTMPIGMNKGDFATMKDMGQFQNYSKPSNLYSWYVGVKVGILFEMPKKRGCNCLRNNVIKPWKKDFENKGVE